MIGSPFNFHIRTFCPEPDAKRYSSPFEAIVVIIKSSISLLFKPQSAFLDRVKWNNNYYLRNLSLAKKFG